MLIKVRAEGTESGIYYHATPVENLRSIFMCGLLTSADGLVHLTKDEVSAVRCCASKGYRRIASFQICIEDPGTLVNIENSACKIVNCECVGCSKNIPAERILDTKLWDLNKQVL